jgi:hypothetical protein
MMTAHIVYRHHGEAKHHFAVTAGISTFTLILIYVLSVFDVNVAE